jgi:Protein of unknown function (DUF4019)
MPMDETAEQATLSAAGTWLALVDANDYVESWGQASSLFKSGLQTASLFRPGKSEQQWRGSLAALQTQLGRVKARSLKSMHYAEELPFEPDGEYAVLKYRTFYEQGVEGGETVILMKEWDGQWRVSDYRILVPHS